jgi:ComF family protein
LIRLASRLASSALETAPRPAAACGAACATSAAGNGERLARDEPAMHLNAILRGLLDLVAPPRCLACDSELSPTTTRGFCEACDLLLDRGERIGSAISAFKYGGPMADAIRRFKYGGRPDLAGPLGTLLAARALELLGHVDAVVPVPLHGVRLRQRGFNQSALLARPVARALSVPLSTLELRRARDTVPQASLSASDRLSNVRGAFVALSAPGARVLLIDDVQTSGATLAECAVALAAAGVEHVTTLVLARAEG